MFLCLLCRAALCLTTADSHPKTIYTKSDLDRAEKNIEMHEWARTRKKQVVINADNAIKNFPLETAKQFIPRTTPGTNSFCPNCVVKGKNWQADGSWTWTQKSRDQVTCKICGMTFPNGEYPEDRVFASKYDPGQSISYVSKGGPQTCLSYNNCYASPSGYIRRRKIQYLVSSIMYPVALGYVATKDESYAAYVRELLLKLSEVLPKYLVYEGYSYNEYADCDPRLAAKNILSLPEGCRKITAAGVIENATGLEMFSGYWSASRLGTSGMDGSTVQQIAMSYDFTASSSVYSDEERGIIERDVVEEAAYLGYCDDDINNKAIGNRAAVAVAGLAIDSYEMARFGIDGFNKTINDWFLLDGGTSESAAYAVQTINGLVTYGKAFRDYSDPASAPDQKYNHFNANTDTMFDQVWQYLVWTLQGNFNYAPLADSYVTTTLSASYCEYLATYFPRKEYLRLSAERTGSATPTVDALFHRDPYFDVGDDEPFTFRDIVFPYLAQGYLRTGASGRDSVVILDASDYGSHHHRDSLNLVYWKDNRELLNDLGYLHDHPDRSETVKSSAHNTVVIDGTEQIRTGRGGSFHAFAGRNGSFKVMQASSSAYRQADVFHRTVAQVEHGAHSYIVDIFRVKGGEKQEYVFHMPNMSHSLNEESDLKFTEPEQQEQVRFALHINIDDKTTGHAWIEVSDVVIQEEFINGTLGQNYAGDPFPSDIQDKCDCRPGTTWCHFGSRYTWRYVDGFKTGGVHLESTDGTSVGVMIGLSTGFTGENTFTGKLGSRYRVSFYMKASVIPSKIQFIYWPPGMESDMSSRVYSRMTIEQPGQSSPGVPSSVSDHEWTPCVGYVDIGQRITEFSKLGGQTSKAWQVHSQIDSNYTFSAFVPARLNEWVYYENGWGQRDYKDADKGATLPYFYIQRKSKDLTTFVCVYEGYYLGQGRIQGVELYDQGAGNIGIRVSTKDGNDHILSSFDGAKVSAFGRVSTCSLSIDTYEETVYMLNGTQYTTPSMKATSEWNEVGGQTESFANTDNDSWFVVRGLPASYVTGQSLHVTYDDGIERAYPIFKVESLGDVTRVYTRMDGAGFRLQKNGHWRLSNFMEWKNGEPETETVPIPSHSSELPEPAHSGLGSGAIAAIVVVVLVSVVVVGIAVLYLVRRRKRTYHSYSDSSESVVYRSLGSVDVP